MSHAKLLLTIHKVVFNSKREALYDRDERKVLVTDMTLRILEKLASDGNVSRM
jgi:hypothetical protein